MRCTVCQGSGKIIKLRAPGVVTFIKDPLELTQIRVQEECPECRGRGEIKEPAPTWTATGASIIQKQKDADDWLVKKLTDLFHQASQYQFSVWQKSIYNDIDNLSGVTKMHQGIPREEDPDLPIKKMMIHVMLDIVGESFFPSNQLYQLAAALLVENRSEFMIGVIDEETHFKEEWEVSRMGRTWKGWGGIDEQVAKVWLDENKAVLCAKFPYKQKVIDEIRSKIPKGKKSWNPEDKVWEFSVEAIDVILEILGGNFDKVIDLTQAAPPMPVQHNGTDPLLSLLDMDDIQKIHRLLSKKYHPDVGGDADKMAKINQIFNKVKGG